MPEFEQHGYQGFWIPGRHLDGEHGVVVVIKRRFNINTIEATCEPSDETPPVAFMAEFYDDAEQPNVSVRHPAEVASQKGRVDIMVRGTAFAPGGKPVPEFECGIRIPSVIERRLRIIGDRTCEWFPPLKDLTYKDLAKGEEWEWLEPEFSEPAPIDKLPLRYEYAYGGWAKIVMTEDEEEMAEEAAGIGEVVEKRRDRKKEIEAEIKAKEADEKQAKKDEGKPKALDAAAQKKADEAFADDGEEKRDGLTTTLSTDLAARIDAEEAGDDGMKIASALRLGEHLPDRPDQLEEPDDDEVEPDAVDAEDDDAEAEEEDDGPFTSSKTQTIDLAELKKQDELRKKLADDAEDRRRELKDQDGVLRDRREEYGDLKLTGDDWAAQYMRQRPKKKKKKRDESELPEMPCPTNPSGKGFAVNHREEAIEGLQLPNIEDPNNPLRPEDLVVELNEEFTLAKVPGPAGWAPYPMAWYPRASLLGVYPWDMETAIAARENATKDYDPEDPDDKPIIEAIMNSPLPEMQVGAFQEAHPTMQVPEIRGDEDVYLTNLTPDGNLFFRLPGLHPTVTIDMSLGPEPLALRLDTVLFDLEDEEKPAVELAWRGWYPIASPDELQERPYRGVNIIEVDQHDWLDVKRDEAAVEAGKKKTQVTGFIDAISDEDLEAMGDTEKKYRDQFKKGSDGIGVRKDNIEDAAVFDQDEDRRMSTDHWDDAIRAEKDGFHDEAARLAALGDEEREKEIRRIAREQVDEEFGIIRDDDGEILDVIPDED